jgi:hypothetical protein
MIDLSSKLFKTYAIFVHIVRKVKRKRRKKIVMKNRKWSLKPIKLLKMVYSKAF